MGSLYLSHTFANDNLYRLRMTDSDMDTDTDTITGTETNTNIGTDPDNDTDADIPEETNPLFFARLPRPEMHFVDLWLINHDARILICPGAGPGRRLLAFLSRPQMMIPRRLAPVPQICLASPDLATFRDVSKSLHGQGMERH